MALSLCVPFTADKALFNPLSVHSSIQSGIATSSLPSLPSLPDKLTLPIVSNSHGSTLLKLDYADSTQFRTFLREELDVTRLNKINKHLKYAGLERPCRPLHCQMLLGRDIWVCEQADLHLLWEDSHIYVKPLPEFLLEYRIWEQHLCKDLSLYQDAKGFLLSYIWLVARRSDLRIAHDKGLIPAAITWEHWIGFVGEIINNIDYDTFSDVNIRYRRGELRLYRVKWIYRLCSKTWNDDGFFRAYHFAYHTYGSFVAKNLTLLTTAIVYVALVLTAMQVGLATNQLKDNDSFNAASYGFTVFSILAPLVVIGVVLLVTAYLLIKNWIFSIRSAKTQGPQPLDRFPH